MPQTYSTRIPTISKLGQQAAADPVNTAMQYGMAPTGTLAQQPINTAPQIVQGNTLGSIGYNAPVNYSASQYTPSSWLSDAAKNLYGKQAGLIDTNKQILDTRLADQQKLANSWIGKAQPYVSTFSNLTQGLTGLADIYLGFQQLDIAKDQLSMAKEQWTETKQELARVKAARERNTKRFNAPTPV